MASVYENAFITIAATWSADSNKGCFVKSVATLHTQQLRSSGLRLHVPAAEDFPLSDYVLVADNPNWPLLRRAWVFQERRLSPRVIHFTKSQIVRECQSARRSEDGLLDVDWSAGAQVVKQNDLSVTTQYPFKFPFADSEQDWRRTVTYYSSLNLTFDKDRLPAIAAIVERAMRERKRDRYIAGMWASSILNDAAWYRHEDGRGTKRPTTSAPTWSWASIRGSVLFHHVSILSSVRLLDMSYQANGPAHVGEVEHASLQIRGPILTASLKDTRAFETSPIYVNENLYDIRPQIPHEYRQLKPMLWRFEPDYDLSTGARPVDVKAKYPILMLWSNEREHRRFGLVLRRVSGTDFERLGICHVSYRDTPSQTKTCQNMIDALPIGSLRII